MGKTISRTALYEAVWAQPISKLAKEFGISDVALAKSCQKMAVPLPPRGYWARKTAGKRVVQAALPPRPPGLEEDTTIGAGRNYWYYRPSIPDDELLGPIPPVPTFEEPIESVRARIEAMIGRTAILQRTLDQPHPIVAKLLKQDEERRAKSAGQVYIASWERVIYDTSLQQRRLRLLSSILLTCSRCGCSVEFGHRLEQAKPQDDFRVIVGDQRIELSVAVVEAPTKRGGHGAGRPPAPTVRVALKPNGPVWEDVDASSGQVTREIAVAIVLKGEEVLRADAMSSHAWRIKQREELIERRRKEAEEAARRERERLAELERQRVARLLGEADALRKARAIRAYVEEVRAASPASPALPATQLETWATWALAQADRIDPVLSGAFMQTMQSQSD